MWNNSETTLHLFIKIARSLKKKFSEYGLQPEEKLVTSSTPLLFFINNFTKSNTLPWVFFTFFKLYKWDQIVQSIAKNILCPDLQTFLVESIPHCFWLIREGCQMPNTEPLLYQTEKNSYWTCSIKKAVLKNFAIFT